MSDAQKPGWGQTYRSALHAAVLTQVIWWVLPHALHAFGRSGIELSTPMLLVMALERDFRDGGWQLVPLFLLLHLSVEVRGWIRPGSRWWLVPQTGFVGLTSWLLLLCREGLSYR